MADKKERPPERIVKAGRKLFFSLGFSKVSTDMLSKEASVSKATLYKYFPSMVDVLKAVVEAEAEGFEGGLTTLVTSHEDLRSVLTQYGANLMTFLNQPEIVQFSQLMNEEARAHPDIAAEFYHVSYRRTLQTIADLIQQGIDKGFVKTDLEAAEMAEQLIGMWEGVALVRAQLGISKQPFPKPAAWSEKCVATLLK